MANATRVQLLVACVCALLATGVGAPAAFGAPPANDNFADATVVATPTAGVPTTLTGQSTIEATAETNEPAHAGFAATNSIWYSFTPDASGRFGFYICSTSANLAVYTGSSVDALTAVTGASRPAGCSSSNSINFVAHTGTTYHLVVDTSSETTPITFRLEFLGAGAANDDFADATAVPSPTTGLPTTVTNQTTVAATPEPSEPAHAGFAANNSVWYSLTSGAHGDYAFYICSTSAKLAVYTGSALNALTEITSGTPSTGCSSSNGVTFLADAGTTYHLVVDTFSQTTFTFRLEFVGAAGVPVDVLPYSSFHDGGQPP